MEEWRWILINFFLMKNTETKALNNLYAPFFANALSRRIELTLTVIR